jgi:hypothetical protein
MRILVLLIVVLAAGCSSSGPDAVGEARVIHDPAHAKPGEGYRIAPADPNEQVFQPDPKLAGGQKPE